MKRLVVCFTFLFLMSLSFALAENYDGETTTYTTSGVYSCTKTANYAFWTETNGEQSTITMIYNSSYSANNCNLDDLFNQTCCPTDYACNLSSGACSLNISNPSRTCASLKTAAECAGATKEIYLVSAGGISNTVKNSCGTTSAAWYNANSAVCYNFSSCECTWNVTASSCVFATNLTDICGNSSSFNTQCQWIESSQEDHCTDALGIIRVNYSVVGTSVGVDPNCVSVVQDFPCSVSVKLPFFDKFSFILSILGISLVYFLIRRK